MLIPILLSLTLTLGVADIPAPTGTPWVRHTIDATSDGADGVRMADMNGDGLPDIATGWEEGNSIRVYVNPGAKHAKEPWPKVVVGEVGAPEDAVLADMDGDGAMDVVSCSEGNEQQVWFHWGPKDSSTMLKGSAWETVALPAAAKHAKWMYSVPHDVNGDGRLDLVAGAKNDGAAIGWFESPENPRNVAAWTWHSMREAGWIMSLELHDMNGDGNLDVVYTDRRGSRRGMGWLEHPGKGEASLMQKNWRDHIIGGTDREVMFLTHASVDPANSSAWWCTTRDGGIQRFSQDDGGAWQRREVPMPLESGTGKGLALGDLNGDGQNDLVVSCEHAEDKHGLFWLNHADGAGWTAHTIGGKAGTKFDLVVLHDFDADMDLDVLTCEEREGLGVVWYENPLY